MKWIVRCPAKINTFLSVGPKDSKGWHPLRTIFQAIELCDELEIELTDKTEIVSNVGWLPTDNSVTKAIALLSEAIDLPPLKVTVRKLIPTESGLGGGSSDAAGILRVGQQIVGKHLPQDQLIQIALKLGADVPFFLVGGRASAEGYGEQLTPLPDQPERWLVLVRPPVGCPTPQMYQSLDTLSYYWKPFPEGDELYNDFERVAPAACLNLIRDLRQLGAEDAGMSGSGSAVFGRFGSERTAKEVADQLKNAGIGDISAVRTLPRNGSLQIKIACEFNENTI